MEHVDTLINARWLIPIEPLGRVLEDHALAIRQGRIVAVGPSAELARQYQADETLQRADHVLLPGFVNAHTHAAMSLLRGAAESASGERWLKAQIQPLEQ